MRSEACRSTLPDGVWPRGLRCFPRRTLPRRDRGGAGAGRGVPGSPSSSSPKAWNEHAVVLAAGVDPRRGARILAATVPEQFSKSSLQGVERTPRRPRPRRGPTARRSNIDRHGAGGTARRRCQYLRLNGQAIRPFWKRFWRPDQSTTPCDVRATSAALICCGPLLLPRDSYEAA